MTFIGFQAAMDKARRIRLHPNAVGMEVAKPEQLIVDSKMDSIMSTLQAVYGTGSREKKDIVILNAAAAACSKQSCPQS